MEEESILFPQQEMTILDASISTNATRLSIYEGFSTIELYFLNWIGAPNAILSFVCSLFICIHVIRRSKQQQQQQQQQQRRTYHRLIFGLSVADMISSMSQFVAIIFLFESDGPDRDSDALCTACGFTLYLGLGIAALYNMLLSIYFVLVVCFNIKNNILVHRVEPALHFSALTYVIVGAIFALARKAFFYSRFQLGCWVVPMPEGCELDSDVECLRDTDVYWWGAQITSYATFFILIVCNTYLYCTIRSTEAKNQRYLRPFRKAAQQQQQQQQWWLWLCCINRRKRSRRRRSTAITLEMQQQRHSSGQQEGEEQQEGEQQQRNDEEGRAGEMTATSETERQHLDEQKEEEEEKEDDDQEDCERAAATLANTTQNAITTTAAALQNKKTRLAARNTSSPDATSLLENQQQQQQQQQPRQQRQRRRSSLKYKHSRRVAVQSFYLCGGFFITYAFANIVGFMDDPNGTRWAFALTLLERFFLPAQGIFDALVYFRPRFLSWRRLNKEKSWLWSLGMTLFTIQQPQRKVRTVEDNEGINNNDNDDDGHDDDNDEHNNNCNDDNTKPLVLVSALPHDNDPVGETHDIEQENSKRSSNFSRAMDETENCNDDDDFKEDDFKKSISSESNAAPEQQETVTNNTAIFPIKGNRRMCNSARTVSHRRDSAWGRSFFARRSLPVPLDDTTANTTTTAAVVKGRDHVIQEVDEEDTPTSVFFEFISARVDRKSSRRESLGLMEIQQLERRAID